MVSARTAPRVSAVSGSRHTRISALAKKASRSPTPAKHSTPASRFGVRDHPETRNPSPRSITAATAPKLPSPITPTRVCGAVRPDGISTHRRAACPAMAAGKSRSSASAARHTHSPIR